MNTAQTEPRELANARVRLENLKAKLIGAEDAEFEAIFQEQVLVEKIIAAHAADFAEAESARVKDEERQFANSKPPWAFP